MSGHTVALGLALLVWFTVSLAVAVDAARRGRYGGVWLLTTFLLGPIGILLYVLVVLSDLASPGDGSVDEREITHVCSACGTVHRDAPGQCTGCGKLLGPADEPQFARLVRSGSRGYCGECKTEVDLDADACPNCRSLF